MAPPVIVKKRSKPRVTPTVSSRRGGGGPVIVAKRGAPGQARVIATNKGGGGGGGGFNFGRFVGGIGHYGKEIGYGVLPGVLGTAVATAEDIGGISSGKFFGEIAHGRAPHSAIVSKIIVPQAKGYYTYGQHPLRHLYAGDIFTPAIAALTVAAPALGRLGAASVAETAAERSAALLTGKVQGLKTLEVATPAGGTQVVRVLPRGGISAGRMVLTHRALERYTKPETPLIGAHKRIARAGTKRAQKNYLRALGNPVVKKWVRAFEALTEDEKAAIGMLKRTPDPADLEKIKAIWRTQKSETAKQTLEYVESPGFKNAYENWRENPSMVKTLDAWEGIGPAAQKLLEDRGALTPEGALEGAYGHSMIARGAYVLTKSKTHRQLRKIDARLARITRGRASTVRVAREDLGYKDIRQSIREGRAIAAGYKVQDRYDRSSAAVEARGGEARQIRQQVERLMAGEMDVGTLHDLGIELPKETTRIGGVGAAMVEAELKARLQNLYDSLSKINPRTARPGWEQPLVAEVDFLTKKVQSLHPTKQAPWRARVQGDLAKVKKELKSLRGHAAVRGGIENQITKVKQDLADLHSGALIDTPFEDIRMRVLGQAYDKLEPAYLAYQKAIARQSMVLRRLEHYGNLEERSAKNQGALEAAREKRIVLLQQARAHMEDLIRTQFLLEQLRARVESHRGKLYLPGKPDEFGVATRAEPIDLMNDFQARGIEQPGFMPDQPAGRVPENFAMALPGIGAVRPGGTVFGLGGELFRTGQFDLIGDVLTQRYLDNAKWAYRHDLHAWAKTIARKVPRGSDLPEGYEWLRQYRGERIPFEQTTKREHLLANEESFSLDGTPEMTGKDLRPSEIEGDGQYLLAVPTQIAEHFRNDFKKARTGWKKVFDSYTATWRRLILHLRIPWLENNIFGNLVLGGIRFAGINGLKAFLDVIGQTKGGAAVQKLLNMDATKRGLSLEDQLDLFPEQGRPGTFYGSSLPPSHALRKPGIKQVRKVGRAIVTALPKADIAIETGIRRAAINTILRGSPEVKALYRAMPEQTRNWRDAMKQGLDENPHLVDQVSREVNDALGDYLSLTQTEKNSIRAVIPFYAWYREITRIAFKLPLDAPGRTAMFLALGQVGSQFSPEDVPSYLRGGFAFGGTGGGMQSIINLRPAMPFSSVLDLARAAEPFYRGPTQQNLQPVIGILNPGIGSLAQAALRPQDAAPLALQPILGVGQDLPQYRLINPQSSTLYPQRTRWDLVLQYLGDLRRRYDIEEASTRHAEGK